MKWVIPSLFWLYAVHAGAQYNWSAAVALSSDKATVWDAIELEDGSFLSAASTFSISGTRTWSIHLDASGNVLGSSPIAVPNMSMIGTVLLNIDNTPILLGSAWDSTDFTHHGLTYARLDANGEPLSMMHHQVGDGSMYIEFQNASIDQSGRIFIAGGAHTDIAWLANRFIACSVMIISERMQDMQFAPKG